jgi:hypothetical protein
MIEWVQHLFGFCGDSHSHLDLTDMFLFGGASMGMYSLKYHIRGTYYIAKYFFFPIKND